MYENISESGEVESISGDESQSFPDVNILFNDP